ncbi:uncharacterized protein E0L32_002102 [Thyridium curvatum]|uniref:Zn(2)-C6 fungal-type domain-containing protein n=1 Tax=Thyridium curvatum TaxID=1093900 RepID=A0A507ARC8_9PEZI|nr:uncharacterized protein E0L32_002031 [Thyridium curvatum]XP_030989210.1 uncharacterized protein E0L32_002102 [Thyridium curvatum]TPX07428.1 hypothetical protein E0L32_002031 [Thyridium curvatum]TPX07499.1 hypothetical protein E0L32_002102 [Thyridium curvatum]
MRAWLSGLWVENGEMRLVYYGDANEKRPNGGGVDYVAVRRCEPPVVSTARLAKTRNRPNPQHTLKSWRARPAMDRSDGGEPRPQKRTRASASRLPIARSRADLRYVVSYSSLRFQSIARTRDIARNADQIRKRHLKCDEAKPVCLRCQKDQWKCDGYLDPVPPRRQISAVSASASASSSASTAASSATPSCSVLSPALEYGGSQALLSPADKRSLHHALQCTLWQMAGGSKALRAFWLHDVPLLGHHLGAVHHTLIALGAAHESFLVDSMLPKSSSSSLPPPPPSGSCAGGKSLVLQHYNLAIQEIRPLMTDPKPKDLQTVLVCCLVFVCIDFTRGQYDSAVRHLRAGSQVLVSFLDAIKLSSSKVPVDRRKWHELVRDHGIQPDQMLAVIELFSRLGTNLSGALDENVVSHLALFGTTPLLGSHVESDSFASLSDAEDELRAIETAYETWYDQIAIENTSESGLPRNRSAGLQFRRSIALQIEDHHTANWKRLCQRFWDWSTKLDAFASSHMLNATGNAVENTEYLRMLVLQKVWTSTFKGDSWVFGLADGIAPEDLEAIFDCVQLLMQSIPPSEHPVFTLDGLIIPPLAYVGWLTEDTNLLQKVVDVLRTMDRREGGWDSKDLSEIFEALLVARRQESKLEHVPGGTLLVMRDLLALGLPCIAPTNRSVQFIKAFLEYQRRRTDNFDRRIAL